MSFRGVFIAIVLGTALVVAAFTINRYRPKVEINKASVELIRATGKCAECHRHETSAVVHEFEMSKHAAAGVTCMACHQALEDKGQEKQEHHGFLMNSKVTALNCSQCHQKQYDEYLKSRHAAPSWAAVTGKDDFTVEQIAYAEQFHKGAVDRPANALTKIESVASINRGCRQCHDIGEPNKDGSIGTCTKCHARHNASVELARLPETCGSCHMGPDHSQMEIYKESKHGVLFNAQRASMNLKADPKTLSTADMPVPTCSTCHMGGLDGGKFTHDTSERLSYYLFAAVSEKRPNAADAQRQMKSICLKCHANPGIIKFYSEAERVVRSTNTLVKEAEAVMKRLNDKKLLTPEPFDEPIEYLYFDLWHYGGRTAKHGAFMGGADFVQWHGTYEVVQKLQELKSLAEEIEHRAATSTAKPEAETKKDAAAAISAPKPPATTEAEASPRAFAGPATEGDVHAFAGR
jgi:hypothetical protein